MAFDDLVRDRYGLHIHYREVKSSSLLQLLKTRTGNLLEIRKLITFDGPSSCRDPQEVNVFLCVCLPNSWD